MSSMKKIIAVVLVLVAPVIGAHAGTGLEKCNSMDECRDALDNGDKDTTKAFETKIKDSYFWQKSDAYEILVFLLTQGAKPKREILDNFYSDYLLGVCKNPQGTPTAARKKFFDELNSKYGVAYKLTYDPDYGLRFYFDMLALSSRLTDTEIFCALSAIAQYGHDKTEVLSYALGRAQYLQNAKLEQAIITLQTEIQTQKGR